jgi:hypothetical protein
MYHAHDELQKTTTRGLEMYWAYAYAGRTNNEQQQQNFPFRNAHNPRFCQIRRGYEIEFSLTRHPTLGGLKDASILSQILSTWDKCHQRTHTID